MLFLFVLLCSCVSTPLFEQPLSPPDTATPDDQLIGTWFYSGESGTGFLHIGWDDNNSSLINLVFADFEPNRFASPLDKEAEERGNNYLNSLQREGHPTSVDEHRYLNMRVMAEERDDEEDYLFTIARYEITGPDTMSLYFLSKNYLEEAASEGELHGEQTGYGFVISDMPDILIRFLESAPMSELYDQDRSKVYRKLDLYEVAPGPAE